MLFHSVFSAETAVYHDVFSSRIAAPWDEGRVRQAVAAAMRRHAVLRTSLAPSGYSRPLQLVHRDVAVPLAVEDLRALSAEEQEARVAAWLQAEKQRTFDWTVAPLFLIQVHRLAESQFQLSLSFHHAILDGWSVATLLAELFAEVGAMQEGVAAAIPPPGRSYRDFVALEAAAVDSPETRAYWQDLLAGHSRTQLPRLPGVRGGLGTLGVEQRQLDPRLTAGVKTLAQHSGVPLKTVLLAAHLRVLALVSGQADVLTGLVSNSRPEEADGERVLGLFLNTLPMRLTLRPESWPALLQRVFQAEREGLPHRRYPAGRLQREHPGEPLYETAFNYNHFHVYGRLEGRPGLEISRPQVFERTNFTFVASFQQSPDSTAVELTLTYDAGQLSEEQVSAIAGYYERAFESMVETPEQPYQWQSLLSPEEEKELLSWNANEQKYLPELCVHEAFATKAA